MANRINWTNVPLIEWPPPPPREPCPHCCSRTTPHYVDSHDQGDSSRLRHAICRDCSRPFRILIETNPSDLEID